MEPGRRQPEGGRADESGVERRARERLESIRRRGEESDDPIVAPVEREIEALLDHLERLRGLEERLTLSLLRAETYVDTELMQMEARTPRYSPERFPERERFQRRLADIERQRRDLGERQEERRQRLRDRLLDAVNRHELLDEADR